MKSIISKGILINVDSEQTNQIYQNPDFSVCDCSYCINFYKTIEKNAPVELITLLKQLGIEILKPSEAVEYGRLDDKNLYIVDYHFIGSFNEKSQTQTTLDTTNFDYDFYLNDRSLASKLFDNYNIVALSVSILLPWVLDEKHE